MSEVKVFRVIGEIRKPSFRTDFRKEIRAVRKEDALEKIYMELGSRHRVKRFHIRIVKVEEIGPEDIENPLVKRLTVGEKEGVE